ncbi:hypothetical protein UPTC5084_00661 [Campylobacter lari]|uniref:DUF5675 family protein n=1 Tax=Campylobacter lari TaxID=201 RepID=UPI0021527008|nr:DUF5675 family protein [Campylobacter lari]MCR6525486.1 DUF5675 family protein [Campylobacter lari]
MKLKLTRKYLRNTCVIGEFKVLDEKENILFECFSLEEDKEGIKRKKDLRVPAGVYDLKRHINSSFNDKGKKEVAGVIVLKEDDSVLNIYNDDVPFDRHILIHWGNTDKDTEGCILLGLTKSDESIGQSRQACKKLYDLLYQQDLSNIKLEITNKF